MARLRLRKFKRTHYQRASSIANLLCEIAVLAENRAAAFGAEVNIAQRPRTSRFFSGFGAHCWRRIFAIQLLNDKRSQPGLQVWSEAVVVHAEFVRLIFDLEPN